MNRCHSGRAHLALAASLLVPLASSLAPLPAAAQIAAIRQAPRDVVLGKMTVVAAPAIEMDGKPDRLSPGSRIRDLNNMLVLSGNLHGRTVPVVYRREATTGMVHEVWILSEDEYKQLAKVSGTSTDGLQKFIDTLAAVWASRR